MTDSWSFYEGLRMTLGCGLLIQHAQVLVTLQAEMRMKTTTRTMVS